MEEAVAAEPAECSVSGDMHFTTFDGHKYTFEATCQYILAKSRTSGKFAVILQNAPCGQNQDGACIQSVSLILNQDTKSQVTLSHSGDVLIYDQYKVNLPYIDDSFEVKKLSSVFLQVKSYIGLKMLYDREGLRLYLEVDARWKDDTVGLCGTFNGNTQDDFLSPVGVPESTPQLFGNSWKTSSACVSEQGNSPVDPCDIHLQAAAYATEVCSIMTKELFAPCFSYLSPLPYFEQCRQDTCKCGHICMCSILSHYAHLCLRYGVEVDFRSHVPECALSCGDTMEYSVCVSTCGRTCQTVSVPETCGDDCVEGCTCPPGMYLNIKTDRCVQRNECPCYFQGTDYPPGENIITSLGKCHCEDGIMNCEEGDTVHNCPDGQIYVNCSNPLTMELGRERTCENELLNLTLSSHLACFSGCTCPHGFVKHGDGCFKPEECPCSWKGKEYFPGDKVISSCHTCVCHHGSFECTFHPCPSMCTAYGDRHYRTFDGLSFDYVGNCKVYLVKSSSFTGFSIITENINCFNTGIICRKYISINIGKSFIIFDDDTGDPSPSSYIDKLQQIFIWKAGFFTIVYFPNEHITIMWDQRTTVHVETGPHWQGELTGLCGNFDSKTINEMRTPENFELTNAQEFGSSWTATECVDSSDIQHPCILNPLRELFAKKECGILLSEVFESCHPVVDVTWYYSNCLTDTCGCNQGGDCECFCTSVSSYAHQCCQQGVMVDWRSPRLCRKYDNQTVLCSLGKGPYMLVSYLDRKVALGAKLLDGSVFPARRDVFAPGEAVNFMLTSGLYKPKAHDPSLVSFEAADRPNYFLSLVSNNTLVLSKWERNESFQNRSTFAIHKNTWLSGYSSFESFAMPGAFIHISASSVDVVKYRHSEAFRLSTLFKLIDTELTSVTHSTCEWRYDVCTSPCFKTCRDPLAEHCQAVPKVEGCVPMCPLNMVLDEVTQRCVYFADCTETTHEFPEAKFSTPLLPNITVLTTATTKNISTHTAFDESTIPVFSQLALNVSFPSIADVALSTTTIDTGTMPSKQTISEIKVIGTDSFPTKETERKPDIITEGKTFLLGTLRPERISHFSTKATLPVFELSSHLPTANQTTTLDRTKLSVSQPSVMVANVTLTSFSPLFTISSTPRPTVRAVPSETTKITVPLVEEGIKTMLTPVPQVLTQSTTKIPTDQSMLFSTVKKGMVQTSSITHTPHSYFFPYLPTVSKPDMLSSTHTKLPGTMSPTSIGSKELLQTGLTSEYSPFIPPSVTESVSALYTSPVSSHDTRVTPLPTQISSKRTTPSELKTLTSVSHKTSAEYKPPFSLKTTKISVMPDYLGATEKPETTKTDFTQAVTALVFSHTEQSKTDLPTTKQVLTTSKTFLSPSTLLPVSESTSPSLYTLEAPETSAVSQTDTLEGAFLMPIVSTPVTSTRRNITKISVLSKQVPLSTVSYTSVLPVVKVTPATPHFTTTTESAPLRITTVSKSPTVAKVPASSIDSLLMLPVHPNATVTIPVPTNLSTKSVDYSATEYSPGVTVVESGVTTPLFMPSKETATLPICVPITEDECIKHICLDGQLIQVNKSQNCPYNATQPSCGFLGLAVQINGDKCCPKWECACQCTLFSDLSIITFDGHHLTLFKEASYVVTQTQDETISVHVADCRSTHEGILTSTKLCLVVLNLTYMSNRIVIDRLNRKIAVNSRYAWPTIKKYGFKIEDTGFMYVIETPTNIRIQWFHTTGLMVVELNTTSDPKPMGLCGFCDGNSANDLMLPNMTVLGTVDSSVTFTNSWQVPNTLKYIGEPRTYETNCSVTDCSPCLNMLMNQTFSSCHPHVSPDSFCDLWVQDTEYIQNPCIALAAYVAMCNKFNVCIEWRSSNYCSFPCPDGFSYKSCISACDSPSTCQSVDVVPRDRDSCSIMTEGCVCAEGTILHRLHSAVCIPEEKCACTDSFGVPHAVGESWKTSPSGCCMHKCVDNEIIAPAEYNCSVSHDLECQRFGEVALLVPDDQSCCHQKICICNQSLCETTVPECKGLEKLATYYQDDSCCPNYICECDPAKCESMEEIPNCRADQTLIAAHVEGTCCVSYICACGICSDQIPECQEGEVLTVDGNTTDRCCPAYQFCEIYRCPQFKCVLGMSLVEVWSPEKCCPYRRCECACDTIPKPQCKLGEKMIIDEQFQNSTENFCHCTQYKCVRDKVCLSSERGVLLPGQSIVEHSPDGVCHTSSCTSIIDPVTKYYQLNISTVDCAARCKSHQIYEPPKDLRTCCGICKNVSCIHSFSNGTLSHFKPGSTWISNCVRYDCKNTPLGPVLITSSISCPPFNETECVKVGGYIVPFLEGCCKT
ncbi:hypothetical protein JRQ81_000359, partial [Phrynocephalus forsythii]